MAAREIVFITGANTGIGFETVKALVHSSRPYHIFLGSRALAKGREAIAEITKIAPQTKSIIEPVEIELTSDESITKAAEFVQSKVGRIDVLINNAGASFDGPDFATDVPDFRSIFNKAYDVNVTGTHIVTATFAPLLLKSSSPRLLFLTSGISTLYGHSRTFLPPFAARPKAGWPKEGVNPSLSYKSSKAALNMVMLNWHWLLKGDGVKTWAISPGFLATNLGGDPEKMRAAGAGDPSFGGSLVRSVVEGKRDADIGQIVSYTGVQAW